MCNADIVDLADIENTSLSGAYKNVCWTTCTWYKNNNNNRLKALNPVMGNFFCLVQPKEAFKYYVITK